MVWLLTPCFLATSGTDFSSASRRIVTICSSVNRVFFMRSSWVEGAILSGFSWSEKPQAGQVRYLADLRSGDETLLRGQRNRVLRLMTRNQPERYDIANVSAIESRRILFADAP